MKRRGLSADALLLLTLLLLFGGLSFQITAHSPADRGDGAFPRRSTNSSRPGGWRAFYLLLQASGLPVTQWTHRPSTWSSRTKVIVSGTEYVEMSEGSSLWSPGEVEAALKWVDAGGTLVLITDRENELTQELNLKLTDPMAQMVDGKVSAALTPAQPAALLQGVGTVSAPGSLYWTEKPGRAVTLLVDRTRKDKDNVPVAIAFSRGKGTIVAIASAGMADNQNIGDAGNARFLTQLLAALCGDEKGKAGQIAFDEFHQGYDEDESLWGIIGQPGHLIVYEIVILALIAAYSAGKRFGLPQPLPEAQRVSSEYVRSLADLYRRGRAGDAALEGIYRSFRRDLCRTIGMPQETPVSELAPAAAAGLAGGDKEVERRLQSWMDTCEAKISGGSRAVLDSELLQIARELQLLRKDLHLGGTDPARSV